MRNARLRYYRKALGVGLLAVIVLLAVPVALWAHAHLKKSAPRAGERLDTPPNNITLWFTEAPELAFSRIAVLGADSTPVALGPIAQLADTRLGMTAQIDASLQPGSYVVQWSTASADGHPVRGHFDFVVLPSASAAASATTSSDSAIHRATGHAGHDSGRVTHRMSSEEGASMEASSPSYVVVRWLSFSSIIVLLGAIAFRALVLSRSIHGPSNEADFVRRTSARVATLGAGAALVVLVSAVARLALQSLAMHGSLDRSAVTMMLEHTMWGASWLLQVGGTVVALSALLIARRGGVIAWTIAGIAALVVAVTPALSGHAIASPRLSGLAVLADTAHVLGAGVWLGSLSVLLVIGIAVALRQPAAERIVVAADLVNRYSPTALTGAGILLISGVFAAWLHLGSLSVLWTSTYGRVLIAKLGVLCLVVGTGAYNWRVARPALGTESGPHRLRRSAAAELVVGAVVVALTAILVALPTPYDAG